jgi:Mannosyltransferase (PIG-M)
MNIESRPALSYKWKVVLVTAVVAAFFLKLYLALKTDGSLDVPGFQDWLLKIQEFGILETYHHIGKFNNPFNHTPFISRLLEAIGFLTEKTGLPFKFWLRLPAILADVGSVVLVSKILELRLQVKARLLIMLAACPISILISGFHGQVDPVMVFFLLLSVYLIESRKDVWLAGMAYGMSLSIKILPIVLAPAIFLYLPKLRERMTWFVSAAVFFVVLSVPYILQRPITILRAMFGYSSIYGAWGWTRLVVWISGVEPYVNGNIYHLTDSQALVSAFGRYSLLVVICVVSFWMNYRSNKPPLFLQCGALLFLFMFITPGYGIQYQSWLIPWVIALSLRPVIIYYAVGGVYVAAEYLCWACWDSFPHICIPHNLWTLGLACWCSIFVVLIFYLRALRQFMSQSTRSGQNFWTPRT